MSNFHVIVRTNSSEFRLANIAGTAEDAQRICDGFAQYVKGRRAKAVDAMTGKIIAYANWMSFR